MYQNLRGYHEKNRQVIFLTLHIDESSYWDSPHLVNRQGALMYFFRHTDGHWSRQRQAGGQWEEEEMPFYKKGKLSAVIDAKGLIHLISFEDGKLSHLQLEENLFSEKQFYTEESKSCSHILLTGDLEGNLHLIYLAVDSQASRWWLLHHRCTLNGWEEPRVIDFGGGQYLNYGDMAADSQGNLHFVYRIKEHDQTGLYYRCFSPGTLNWSKALPLASADDISYPAIAADPGQNLHVIWSEAQEAQYTVHYRPLIRGGWPTGGWKQKTAISPVLSQKPFPLFSEDNGQPAMGWLEPDALCLYRFKQGAWEKMPRQQTDEAILTKVCVLSAEGVPTSYWAITRDGLPVKIQTVEPTADEQQEAELEFKKLHQYSEALVNRASSLSTTKNRLEQTLEEKRKELTWMSQQNKKNIQALQQSLSEKDKELHEIEEKFKETINGLKAKMEQIRKSAEAEKQRGANQIQEYKKERRQFDQILKEKENTIEKLNTRIREQEQRLKQMHTEIESLADRLEQKEEGGFKKFLGKLLHKKP